MLSAWMLYAQNNYIYTSKTGKLHVNSEINYMYKVYTHIVAFPSLIVTYESCKVVTGTVTEWTQAERTGGVVDDHITRPACSITNTILWTGAATHTVSMAWLTPPCSIRERRRGTLCYTERAVLVVATRVTFICALHSYIYTYNFK